MHDNGYVVATSTGAVLGGSAGGPPSGTAGDGALRPELADVGRLLRRGVRGVVGAARAGEAPTLTSIVREHLGDGSGELPVVEETWAPYEHVNVQAGLDDWLASTGGAVHVVGVVGFRHQRFGLGEILTDQREPWGPRPGNVARVNLPAGPDGEVRACVQCAIYLLDEGADRTALLVRAADPESGQARVSLQVVSTRDGRAGEAAAGVRAATSAANVFRGKVLSFGHDVFGYGQTLLAFQRRPELDADHLVLPPETLEAVERQVVGVAAHKERLLAAGQHLKRGLLLYGPPGVGKTHTVRYLTARLTGTTVIQLTGDALGLIGEACSVARALQPSMVVVEDVDLIAEDRGMHPGQHPLLFQLLNEMDGLAEDADVVFVLTTNRADLLEPALAARPGRVDQAVELRLPDADARRALFALYRGGLHVEEGAADDAVAWTDGVTASFLKELLRRAALVAGDRLPHVSRADVAHALDELLDTRNAMTRTLLGGGTEVTLRSPSDDTL
ncbi:ATP-binding protein [Actinotalea sp. AC32]|nr:ATP-binding protein [Actinotalea sp. AC32]